MQSVLGFEVVLFSIMACVCTILKHYKLRNGKEHRLEFRVADLMKKDLSFHAVVFGI
jgi:uncharacterized Tic20 family protein